VVVCPVPVPAPGGWAEVPEPVLLPEPPVWFPVPPWSSESRSAWSPGRWAVRSGSAWA
jgi:hypothetical protein